MNSARFAASDQALPAFIRFASFSSPQSWNWTLALLKRLPMSFGDGLGIALQVRAVQSRAAAVRMRRAVLVILAVWVKILNSRFQL